MDGMYMSHRETPYGWWLWAVAAGRFVARVLGQAPGLRDLDATALTLPPPTAPAPRPDAAARSGEGRWAGFGFH